MLEERLRISNWFKTLFHTYILPQLRIHSFIACDLAKTTPAKNIQISQNDAGIPGPSKEKQYHSDNLFFALLIARS